MGKADTAARVMYRVPGRAAALRIEIREVLVCKATDMYVWVDRPGGRPIIEGRYTKWQSYHDTWEEAHIALSVLVGHRRGQAEAVLTAIAVQEIELSFLARQKGRIDAANVERVATDGVCPA